jgi:hypothetical protein
MSETTRAPQAPIERAQPSLEKTAWWVVFGVLVLSIVVMLGAWN